MAITWPIAKSESGSYVHIMDANRVDLYSCPECAAAFVPRMGQKVRWHFAHQRGVACTGEGARHSIAKHYIAHFLSEPLWVPLQCWCTSFSTRPYRIGFTDVEVEASVGNYRVDVVCQRNGRRVWIEVVDKHPTEPDKAEALGVGLLEVHIKDMSDQDIFQGDKVKERLTSSLSRFLPQIAEGNVVFIHSWTSPCWQCNRSRTIARLCERGISEIWRQSIDAGLLAELRKRGKIEWRRTEIVPEGYFANVCPHCDKVQGDYHLPKDMAEHVLSGGSVETWFWVSNTKGQNPAVQPQKL